MITLIHVIDNMGIGGAQSMMSELYEAINQYYPEYKQVVFSLHQRAILNKGRSSLYDNIPYKIVKKNIFEQKVLSYQNPILFFHKLMQSDTSIYSKLRRKHNIPVITINHSYSPGTIHNKVEKCEILVSVCDKMCDKFQKMYPSIKHTVIHNGVNYKKYQDVKTRQREDKKVFLTGRINKINAIKFSPEWLSWCSRVKLSKKMVHEYIGGGPSFQRIKTLPNKINNGARNQIKLLGEIQDFNNKISIVKSWDVFLYEINRDEGVSMAILEALASGIPVICSNHHGNNEIIEKGINGYIFKTKEDAQRRLMKLCEDPERLKRLKQTTIEHFKEKLDCKIVASKYIDIVRRLANKHYNE